MNKNSNYYAVLMAGGVGSRFWPVSTSAYPKQFHDMLGTGATLLQKTFSRLNNFIPTENILILTNERYNDLVLEQLPMISANQVILEPVMRNTAPCILYAALKIKKMNPDGLMIVAPSDHWIEDEKAFELNVKICFDKCEKEEVICTLGIKPTFPNTGFGYVEFEKADAQKTTSDLFTVKQFREKPDYETAKSFLKQGNFLWNAGIFIWSIKVILDAFKEFQPVQYELFNTGFDMFNTEGEKDFIAKNYSRADNISIDYAILEKARSIFVLPATFDWNDLGTWGSLYHKLEKDEDDNATVNGKVLVDGASGNMIRLPKDKLAVIDGLKDYIIVDKKEVLMIYPKSKEQAIKSVLAEVEKRFGDQYI
ncbi:mannose-1-phosphate guanylyltransferase [uncultured Eudoraea sp.]|uniref:mannose-1-phosphate guanylyltransferase n=1 Tax=uncultured Eudoraea sp. TaxID=1035614 RepID=UPI00261EDCFE|nr:mannose-1-phosphate guanylyltransferase [uncultured Eudoraea sp.]